MNWLITGGAGFIGASLIKKLLKDPNNKLRIVDNLCVGSLEQLNEVCSYTINPPKPGVDRVEFFRADIADLTTLGALTAGVDAIIHLAARSGVRESVEYPQTWFMDNVVGTFNVLECARLNNIKHVVCASSAASIGNAEPPVHEEMPMHPISPYGATKAFMENMCSAYFHSYGIQTVCLRFSNVYGALSEAKSSLVAKFIRAGLNKETFEIYGDGEQTRDFIYIDDLLAALVTCAIIPGVGGQTFQLCSKQERSVNSVVDKLTVLLGEHAPEVVHVGEMVGDIRTNWADNSKIYSYTGWVPKTPFDAGLKATVDWFLQKNKNEV